MEKFQCSRDLSPCFVKLLNPTDYLGLKWKSMPCSLTATRLLLSQGLWLGCWVEAEDLTSSLLRMVIWKLLWMI